MPHAEGPLWIGDRTVSDVSERLGMTQSCLLERFQFRRNHTNERALRLKSSTGSVKVGIALDGAVEGWLQSERPNPGQIWKSLGMWVRVLDVSRGVVTFQGRSGRGGVTRDSLSMFLLLFRRASG